MAEMDDLSADVRRWLKDASIVVRARNFLGGNALGPTKLANWKAA